MTSVRLSVFSLRNGFQDFLMNYSSQLLAGFLFCGILYICIRFFYIRKLRRMKQELEERNQELKRLSGKLEESDVQLQKQPDQKKDPCEEKLSYLAYYDELTGLPNRNGFNRDASTESLLQEGIQTALLYLDIDNFKYINDTMGHTFGDR